MRFTSYKILLPLVLVVLDAWWMHRLDAGKLAVLKELDDMVLLAHFPLGTALPWWATKLSTTSFREGWLLLSPLLANTALLGLALGGWVDWRLAERARGRRGVVDSLMRNFGEPRGLAGRLAAALMNRGNRRLNRYCVDAAAIQPEDKVLDVGFGGGVSFGMILARLGVGSLTGLDPSEDMVARARRRFSRQSRSGRLNLATGSVDSLPFHNKTFDKVVTANTIYFWPDLGAGLKAIRRVLRPAGSLVLGMRPQQVMSRFRDFGFRAYSERQVAVALYRAGFNKIEVEDRADGKFGAKVFRAWTEGATELTREDTEALIADLEKNLGSLLDMEI